MFNPQNLSARALCVLALACLVFALPVSPVAAVARLQNSASLPIAFFSDRDGDSEIYVMAADGSGVKAMTQNTIEDRDPAWAPGGSRLAFISRRDGNPEIYVVNIDGTGLRRLTNRDASDHAITWSPDGRRLAFVSDAGGNMEVWVVAADGSAPPVNLTNHVAQDFNPAWSPTGDEILFNSTRDFKDSQDDMGDLYVVNVADRKPRRLQEPTRRTVMGTWSPLGVIAFYAAPNRLREISTVKPDGTELKNLSTPIQATSDINPIWSPDGRRLAFQSDRDGDGQLEISVMEADGSMVKRLSPAGRPTIGPPSWSADGRSVVFSAFEEGNWEVYGSDLEGRSRRLTNNKAMDLGAVWARAASGRK